MQWIKASERLPLHLAFWNRYDAEDCAFPVRINGKYRAAELFDNRLKGEAEPKYVFSVKGIGGRDYYEEEFHLIEWLDVPAPSPDLEAEAETNRRYASQVEELKVENERLRVALNGIRDKAYSLNIPYELYKDNKWVRGLHTEINGIIDAATDALKPKEEQ